LVSPAEAQPSAQRHQSGRVQGFNRRAERDPVAASSRAGKMAIGFGHCGESFSILVISSLVRGALQENAGFPFGDTCDNLQRVSADAEAVKLLSHLSPVHVHQATSF